MPEDRAERDALFGGLAVERGYVTPAQLAEAATAQRLAREQLGMDQTLSQVLVSKGLLTADQAQDTENAVAVQTGEARLVAGYEVVAKLGQGGFGAVYKARRLETAEFVALKILLPSLATPDLVRRFERESRIVQSLHHPNIVGCVEFGRDQKRGFYFCALEYVDGEDVHNRLERTGAMPEAEAVSIAYQVAQALQHAHYSGLVHRDVKPENIMVTADGTAKLLDLGLARPANMEITRLTQSGVFVGSPYYASPEQALSGPSIDVRSDIYSLGCTLYHMVTGNPPFAGTTALQVLQKHIAEQMPWPQDANPALSDGICRIIAKMMAKKPEDRYRIPKEILYDFDMLRLGRDLAITDDSLRNSSVATRSLRPRARRPDSQRRMPRAVERQRRPESRIGSGPAAPARTSAGGLAALCFLGLALGAAVVLLVVQSDRKRPAIAPAASTASEAPRAPVIVVMPRGSPSEDERQTTDTRTVPPPEEAGPAPTLSLDCGGGVTMELIYIKPGWFTMGSPASEAGRDNDETQHGVTITRGFYLGKYEVTQAQYHAVVGSNPSNWKEPNRPVECVSWNDATEFCSRLTAKWGHLAGAASGATSAVSHGGGGQLDGRPPQGIPTSLQVRLPTEAEWEYACRAGSTTRFCFGDSDGGLGEYAWFGGNAGNQTHAVGGRKPNAWGLYDMHGNVWEWCADAYADYGGTATDTTGPASGGYRVLRGGGWVNDARGCRSALRSWGRPADRNGHIGFRVAADRQE